MNNIRGTLGRFAPELLETEYAREMWALFEQGELIADTKLTGIFARDETVADADGVLVAVEDARKMRFNASWVARTIDRYPRPAGATGGQSLQVVG